MSSVSRSECGFTLLELLIAIAIFSLLAVVSYRLLNSATETQIVTSRVWNELNVLQRARLIIQKDFNHIVARPIRNTEGERKASIYGGIEANRSRYTFINFTRSGWYNFTGDIRSDLQRVAYAFEGKELVRYYWQQLDLAVKTPPVRQIVLDDVQNVSIDFMDKKKHWVKSWPPAQTAQAARMIILPSGIRLTVVHNKAGRLQWVFPGVAEESPQIQSGKQKQAADNKSNNNEDDDEDDDDEDEDD